MQVLSTLGAGIVLAWLSLPVLVWLTRRDREAEPASRHRELIRALVSSALLLGIPALRAAFERSIAGRALPVALVSSGLSSSSGPSWGLTLPRVGAVVLPCIAAVWLLLVTLRSLGIALRIRRVRGLLSRAVAPPASLRELLSREAHALGLPTPVLLVSDEVSVPFTARVRRPAIVLSRAHAEAAEAETLRLILRHELVHVARHDVAVDVGVTLLLALFAGHPSARSMAREIRFAREAAVDANVAPSAPRAYASLLVTMAEHVHGSAQLEVGMDDTELGARVRRILDGPHVHRRSARMAPVAVAFALLACSGAAVTSPEASAGSSAGQATPVAGFSVRLAQRVMPPDPSGKGAEFTLADQVLSREHVRAVRVVPRGEKGPYSERALSLELTPAGERAIAEATAGNVGQHMAILVGDKIVASPVIKTPLRGPSVMITTNTDADLEALANALGASAPTAAPAP
ncbi:MAG: M56 family metallopeptidase [Deltaproteobacteria bacterium]